MSPCGYESYFPLSNSAGLGQLETYFTYLHYVRYASYWSRILVILPPR